MINNIFIHPSLVLIAGALLLPFTKGIVQKTLLILVPVFTLLNIILVNQISGQNVGTILFMDRWELIFGRIDRLSGIFAAIMGLMGIIGTIYSLHIKERWQHTAAWFYVAGSIGVIYAGDYLSLFLFWEMMAFASTFLIWFNTEKGSKAAGYRYLLVHTFGGVMLLMGFVLRFQATGDMSFSLLDNTNPQLYTWLILIGLGLNAAMVPFHSWLPDAYSKASITGSVFMCAFTTKTAVYTLVRAFAGFDILIVIGLVMAVYGIIYALMENNVRRLLGWEIISQVGYMVTGIGLGSALAINGVTAHGVAHILYKGLLFMAAGAVISATGRSKLTELGGLYKHMPSTLIFLLIGSISVSAFPFFSGFVTKSMIISAAFEGHHQAAGFLLTAVSAGTFLAAGLRLPYLLFFKENKSSQYEPNKITPSPWNMQIAMGCAALLCFCIGTFYPLLYHMLPFTSVHYHPYSTYHLSETLQLLFFTGVVFYFLKDYLEAKNKISFDLDWFYRKGGQAVFWLACNPIQWFDTMWGKIYKNVGMYPLMVTAKFWSWFDWHAIDGIVDGTARLVKKVGGQMTILFQRGQIQQTIGITASLAALVLLGYVCSLL